MKLKHLLPALACAVILLSSTCGAHAQDYKNSVGLGIDFGAGSTLVGPTYKHFFNKRSAFQGEILFASGGTLVEAFYQYHMPIKEAPGLKFYVGGGPGAILAPGVSALVFRPMAGLDYKFKGAPLAINFDWRPLLVLIDEASGFEPARFGLGLKYSF